MAKAEEVAKLLDLTVRRVQQLAKEEVIPKAARGKYDAAQCVIAYVRYLRKQLEGEGSMSLTDERTRLAKEQADKQEFENALLRGSLIETALAEEVWSGIVRRVRAKLLAIPVKAAPLLHGRGSAKEIKSVLEDFIAESLDEISEPSLYEEKSKRNNK